MMVLVFLVILGHSLAAMLLGWFYFRRYRINRPPIGVFNLWDIALMMGGILLVPYLYLALPIWVVAGLLGLTAMSVSYFCLEPVLSQRRLVWLLVGTLAGANVAAHRYFGATSAAFFALNNVMQILIVVGITNLWAQSGLKARDAAILAGVLIAYDYLFTSLLPLMDNLFNHLEGLPFAPMIGWPLPNGRYGAIGLGDLLLAAVFPQVMRKAYGQGAGLAALGLALAAVAGVMLLLLSGLWQTSFPVMIVLGPVTIAQYLYRRWQLGEERTMIEYWTRYRPATRQKFSRPCFK
jgi:hypothetical protein